MIIKSEVIPTVLTNPCSSVPQLHASFYAFIPHTEKRLENAMLVTGMQKSYLI